MAILELSHGVSSIRETVFAFIDSESFVGTAISVMVKALGIALVGRICADICRECGEAGLAQGVEAVAGGVIFSLSLPILSEILEFASDVLARGS
jgi:stage III sporulation protein AD